MKKNILVFDVESTNLHGSGFAVGAIVTDPHGTILDRFELLSTDGAQNTNEWVTINVLPHLKDMPRVKTIKELCTKFYEFYMKHKDSCDIWADCAYPVETNFLEKAYSYAPYEREFNMPFPLKDISNFIDIDLDRAEKYKKDTGGNTRKHHPVDDCMCSLHCLIHER